MIVAHTMRDVKKHNVKSPASGMQKQGPTNRVKNEHEPILVS